MKITKKRCKKLLTEPKGYGTILQKTKKVGASALTSSSGKEVNSEKRRAVVGSLFAARMLCAFAFFIFDWRCFGISNVTHQLNEEIRDKEIRLIGDTGEQLGIMSADEALRIAEDRGLDLVKISPQAQPPVCKLMNYGKFKFEQSKREKEAKKNQHVVEIKEIRMSPGIDVGDFNTKLKNAQKFLADGNRVKVSVRFRGREMAHTEIGRDLLTKFAEQCAEAATMDKAPKMEGRSMTMFLSPKTGK